MSRSCLLPAGIFMPDAIHGAVRMLDEAREAAATRSPLLSERFRRLAEALESDLVLHAKPEILITLTYPFEGAGKAKATCARGRWKLADLCLAIGEAYRQAYLLEGFDALPPARDLAGRRIAVEPLPRRLGVRGHGLDELWLEDITLNRGTGLCVPAVGS